MALALVVALVVTAAFAGGWKWKGAGKTATAAPTSLPANAKGPGITTKGWTWGEDVE